MLLGTPDVCVLSQDPGYVSLECKADEKTARISKRTHEEPRAKDADEGPPPTMRLVALAPPTASCWHGWGCRMIVYTRWLPF